MSKKPEQMDEDKLGAFLDNELRQTIGFGEQGDEISEECLRNLEYYLNRPLGDEVDGRSKLQDSSVQDVVEALLPALLAPFISSDTVVEFKPVGQEDEEHAENASAYANHIFMVDNDGVQIQYTWVKDALLQKNGFVYADWTMLDRTSRTQISVNYNGLQQIIEDKEVEILQVAAFDGMGAPIDPAMIEAGQFDPESAQFELDIRRTWKEGRVKVRNIPPEYLLVSNTAVTENDARLIGWQEQVTLSDLREEGYPEEKLENIAFSDGRESDQGGVRYAREQAQGGTLSDSGASESTDESTRKLWRTVVWTKVDFDGDGKAELRKIVRAGAKLTGGNILLNEEADCVPIVSFTAIPMPHQLFGRCPADQTVPIQDGKTAMLRAAMNGTYNTIEPRFAYVESLSNEDTWDDLMLQIPGAPIRMEAPGAVQQIGDAPDLGATYQMLEYFDRIREARTPVTRQDQGVDPNVLQEKTAREATIQANASSQRKELILRLYAESLGKLFKLIHKTTIKHQDKPRQIRLLNKWKEVDPRYWNAEMDVSVSVGLGTGTKDQQMQSLMMINGIQMGDLQVGLPTVDPSKLYNTRAKLCEYSGLSSPELYFNDPDDQQQPQQPPAPSPEQMQAQEQQQKQEADQINAAIEKARAEGKQEGQDQVKLMEIQSKERMHQTDARLKAGDLAIKDKQLNQQPVGGNV